MLDMTISHADAMMQDIQFNKFRMNGAVQEVFCPICEAWHENNSYCQMPGEGF